MLEGTEDKENSRHRWSRQIVTGKRKKKKKKDVSGRLSSH